MADQVTLIALEVECLVVVPVGVGGASEEGGRGHESRLHVSR